MPPIFITEPGAESYCQNFQVRFFFVEDASALLNTESHRQEELAR